MGKKLKLTKKPPTTLLYNYWGFFADVREREGRTFWEKMDESASSISSLGKADRSWNDKSCSSSSFCHFLQHSIPN